MSHLQLSWDLFSMILEITSQSLVTCQIDKDELENKVKDCMVDKKQKGYFDVYTIQQKKLQRRVITLCQLQFFFLKEEETFLTVFMYQKLAAQHKKLSIIIPNLTLLNIWHSSGA